MRRTDLTSTLICYRHVYGANKVVTIEIKEIKKKLKRRLIIIMLFSTAHYFNCEMKETKHFVLTLKALFG